MPITVKEVIILRKKQPGVQDEMLLLRTHIENVEEKLSFTSEPLLVDALSYELLGLRARMNYLFADAKSKSLCEAGSFGDNLHKNI